MRRLFQQFNEHLQYRLLLALVIVMLIPVVITSGLNFNRATSAIYDLSTANQLQNVRTRAALIENALVRTNTDILLLSQSSMLRSYINSRLESSVWKEYSASTMISFMASNPQYFEASIANIDGVDQISVQNSGTGPQLQVLDPLESLSSEDYLRAMIRAPGQIYTSKVRLIHGAKDSSIPIVRYMTPLYTDDSTPVGVLALTVRVQAIIRTMYPSPHESLFIIDDTGGFLMHPDAEKRYGPLRGLRITLQSEKPDVFAATHKDTQGTLQVLGDVYSFAHVTLPNGEGVQWLVISSFPLDFVVGNIMNGQIVVIVFSTLAIGVALLIGFFVTRNIVRPLKALSEAAVAISHGEMDTPLNKPQTRDEVGQLTYAFIQMTSALHINYASLRKRTQELEIASAKAEEAMQVKGEFLANVSHELRTPLNAIIGFSDILLNEMAGPLSDQQRHKLIRLRENGARLLALINDILDLSHMDSGYFDLQKIEFSPRVLVVHLCAQMESLFQSSNLTLATRIADNVPEKVIGDDKRIEQVVINLLSNALKFTANGTITIAVDALPDRNKWQISVADTGVGIPAHATDLIFEEFRQLDGSFSRQYKGTGLGLAITRSLVTAMGGTVQVHSTPGVGSTFTITLPLVTPGETSNQNAIAAKTV